jgi:hypothetical protein
MMHVSFLGLGFSRVFGVKTGIVDSDSLVADEVDWRECAGSLPGQRGIGLILLNEFILFLFR